MSHRQFFAFASFLVLFALLISAPHAGVVAQREAAATKPSSTAPALNRGTIGMASPIPPSRPPLSGTAAAARLLHKKAATA